MKEKIGIALLILLNAGFIYLLVFTAYFSHGFTNGAGTLRAVEIANHVAERIFRIAGFLSFIALVINYILFRFLLRSGRPIIGSIIVTLIGILVFTPFFLSERSSFIEKRYSQIVLSDYIKCKEVSKVDLFIMEDTIAIDYCADFFQVIGTAPYSPGIWKYSGQSMKIMIWKTNGTKDSILTNGELFELSDRKFFKADENLIEKYLQAWQVKTLKDN